MSTAIRLPLASRRTRILTLIAAIALLLVAAAPAGATVIERERYSFEFADAYDDFGFEVAVEGTESGQLRIRAGTGDDDGAFFVRDTYSFSETHTKVETGESLTIGGRGVCNEVRGTRVDGDVFEFTWIEAGQPFVTTDADGDVVLRDRGVVQSLVLFDTGGDDEPGEDVLDITPELRGPHPGFEADFCAVIAPLIGS